MSSMILEDTENVSFRLRSSPTCITPPFPLYPYLPYLPYTFASYDSYTYNLRGERWGVGARSRAWLSPWSRPWRSPPLTPRAALLFRSKPARPSRTLAPLPNAELMAEEGAEEALEGARRARRNDRLPARPRGRCCCQPSPYCTRVGESDAAEICFVTRKL
jgi:hypothetical protein